MFTLLFKLFVERTKNIFWILRNESNPMFGHPIKPHWLLWQGHRNMSEKEDF